MRASHALAVFSRACASRCETPSHPEHIVAETPAPGHGSSRRGITPIGSIAQGNVAKVAAYVFDNSVLVKLDQYKDSCKM